MDVNEINVGDVYIRDINVPYCITVCSVIFEQDFVERVLVVYDEEIETYTMSAPYIKYNYRKLSLEEVMVWKLSL